MKGIALTDYLVVNYTATDRGDCIHFLTEVDFHTKDYKQIIAPNAKVVYTSKFIAWYLRHVLKVSLPVFGIVEKKNEVINYNGKEISFSFLPSKSSTGAVSLIVSGDFGVYLYTGNFCYYKGFEDTICPEMKAIINKQSLKRLYFDATYYEQISSFMSYDELFEKISEIMTQRKSKIIYMVVDKIGLEPLLIDLAARFVKKFPKEVIKVDNKRYNLMTVLGYGHLFTIVEGISRVHMYSTSFLKKQHASDTGYDLILIKRKTELCKDFASYVQKNGWNIFTLYSHSSHESCCQLINTFKPESVIPCLAFIADRKQITFRSKLTKRNSKDGSVEIEPLRKRRKLSNPQEFKKKKKKGKAEPQRINNIPNLLRERRLVINESNHKENSSKNSTYSGDEIGGFIPLIPKHQVDSKPTEKMQEILYTNNQAVRIVGNTTKVDVSKLIKNCESQNFSESNVYSTSSNQNQPAIAKNGKITSSNKINHQQQQQEDPLFIKSNEFRVTENFNSSKFGHHSKSKGNSVSDLSKSNECSEIAIDSKLSFKMRNEHIKQLFLLNATCCRTSFRYKPQNRMLKFSPSAKLKLSLNSKIIRELFTHLIKNRKLSIRLTKEGDSRNVASKEQLIHHTLKSHNNTHKNENIVLRGYEKELKSSLSTNGHVICEEIMPKESKKNKTENIVVNKHKKGVKSPLSTNSNIMCEEIMAMETKNNEMVEKNENIVVSEHEKGAKSPLSTNSLILSGEIMVKETKKNEIEKKNENIVLSEHEKEVKAPNSTNSHIMCEEIMLKKNEVKEKSENVVVSEHEKEVKAPNSTNSHILCDGEYIYCEIIVKETRKNETEEKNENIVVLEYEKGAKSPLSTNNHILSEEIMVKETKKNEMEETNENIVSSEHEKEAKSPHSTNSHIMCEEIIAKETKNNKMEKIENIVSEHEKGVKSTPCTNSLILCDEIMVRETKKNGMEEKNENIAVSEPEKGAKSPLSMSSHMLCEEIKVKETKRNERVEKIENIVSEHEKGVKSPPTNSHIMHVEITAKETKKNEMEEKNENIVGEYEDGAKSPLSTNSQIMCEEITTKGTKKNKMEDKNENVGSFVPELELQFSSNVDCEMENIERDSDQLSKVSLNTSQQYYELKVISLEDNTDIIGDRNKVSHRESSELIISNKILRPDKLHVTTTVDTTVHRMSERVSDDKQTDIHLSSETSTCTMLGEPLISNNDIVKLTELPESKTADSLIEIISETTFCSQRDKLTDESQPREEDTFPEHCLPKTSCSSSYKTLKVHVDRNLERSSGYCYCSIRKCYVPEPSTFQGFSSVKEENKKLRNFNKYIKKCFHQIRF